jgi:hypothetical protein
MARAWLAGASSWWKDLVQLWLAGTWMAGTDAASGGYGRLVTSQRGWAYLPMVEDRDAQHCVVGVYKAPTSLVPYGYYSSSASLTCCVALWVGFRRHMESG